MTLTGSASMDRALDNNNTSSVHTTLVTHGRDKSTSLPPTTDILARTKTVASSKVGSHARESSTPLQGTKGVPTRKYNTQGAHKSGSHVRERLRRASFTLGNYGREKTRLKSPTTIDIGVEKTTLVDATLDSDSAERFRLVPSAVNRHGYGCIERSNRTNMDRKASSKCPSSTRANTVRSDDIDGAMGSSHGIDTATSSYVSPGITKAQINGCNHKTKTGDDGFNNKTTNVRQGDTDTITSRSGNGLNDGIDRNSNNFKVKRQGLLRVDTLSSGVRTPSPFPSQVTMAETAVCPTRNPQTSIMTQLVKVANPSPVQRLILDVSKNPPDPQVAAQRSIRKLRTSHAMQIIAQTNLDRESLDKSEVAHLKSSPKSSGVYNTMPLKRRSATFPKHISFSNLETRSLSSVHSDVKVTVMSELDISNPDDPTQRFRYFAPNIQPFETRAEQSLHRECLASHKRLAAAERTIHSAVPTPVSALRQHARADCRSAFLHTRIPTARRSPAVILWPHPFHSNPRDQYRENPRDLWAWERYNWWMQAGSNIRMDSLGIGSRRVHSWAAGHPAKVKTMTKYLLYVGPTHLSPVPPIRVMKQSISQQAALEKEMRMKERQEYQEKLARFRARNKSLDSVYLTSPVSAMSCDVPSQVRPVVGSQSRSGAPLKSGTGSKIVFGNLLTSGKSDLALVRRRGS